MSLLSNILAFVLPTFGFLIYFCFIKLRALYLVYILASVSLFVIAWNVGNWIFDLVNFQKVSPVGKAVLITGCDSGFGNALARRLCDSGFFVYAGVLFPEGDGARKLAQNYPTQIKVLKMDVTIREEVENAVKILRADPKHKLWAVVNNAGVAWSCPWDWGQDLEYYRKQFEVNIFGNIRVTKNFMPLLRETGGRVVNVASVADRITQPLLNAYTMTKHCVRTFSDSLRRELIDGKVSIVTIEPTFFNTSILDTNYRDRMRSKFLNETPPEIASYYGSQFNRFIGKCNKVSEKFTNQDPNQVVDTMVKAVVLKYPQLYYRCYCYHLGDIFLFWSSYLPDVLQDKMYYALLKP